VNKILAIDTSSEACSAALIINKEVKTLFEIVPQGHSELILTMCSKLLSEAELNLSDLDGLAFSRGPGSFTGLRIGAGVVQGIAFAKDLPVLNVSSLQALAHRVSKAKSNTYILPIIDARMGEIYTHEYYSDASNKLTALGEEQLIRPEHFSTSTLNKYIAIGSGLEILKNCTNNDLPNVLFEEKYSNLLVSAEDIALLAANNTEENKWVNAENVQPIYLRNDVVHRPKNIKAAETK